MSSLQLKWAQRVAYVAPAKITAICMPGPHCVLASAVGQMVLERFGIASTPYVAELNVCNQAWVDWAKDDYEGGRAAQTARGAYLITNRPDWQGESRPAPVAVRKPWDGHLALRLELDGQPWLLDLDSGSFARPDYKIAVTPSILAPLRPGPKGESAEGTFETDAVTYIAYQPLVSPIAQDFLASKDWTERSRYRDLADEIEGAVRSLLVVGQTVVEASE